MFITASDLPTTAGALISFAIFRGNDFAALLAATAALLAITEA